MNDLEKQIWRASRGIPADTAALFTKIFGMLDEMAAEKPAEPDKAQFDRLLALESRITALEAKRNVGRPPKTARGD